MMAGKMGQEMAEEEGWLLRAKVKRLCHGVFSDSVLIS